MIRALLRFNAAIFIGIGRAFETLIQPTETPTRGHELAPQPRPPQGNIGAAATSAPLQPQADPVEPEPPRRGLVLPDEQPVPIPVWVREEDPGDWWGWLLEEAERYDRREPLEHPDRFFDSLRYLVEREVIPCVP